MIHVSATEIKLNTGRVLDDAQHDNVSIEKHGRPFAVLMSQKEYQRLQDIEDMIWAMRADSVKKEDFLSEEESKKFLDDFLDV